MPRSNVFKKGQGDKATLASSKHDRPPVDAYGAVKEAIGTDEDNGQGSNVAEAEKEAPPPAPQPASLPPWLQHFKMIPISQIRPGRYQTRMMDKLDPAKYTQLVNQIRFDFERDKLRLLVFVMPDPKDSTFYNPSRGMHLRVQAAQEVGVTELLCLVAEYDQEDLAYGTFFENLARQDLNIIEQGLMFLLFKEDFDLTQEGIAITYRVPGGRDHVARCIQAAEAAEDIQEMILLDPDRSMRVVTYLSRLDNLEDAASKRKPIIQGFLKKVLTADMVEIAVKKVLDGQVFTLEEQNGNASANSHIITSKVIGRIERAIATRKKLDLYLKEIRNEVPSPDERAELESIQSTIIAILSR